LWLDQQLVRSPRMNKEKRVMNIARRIALFTVPLATALVLGALGCSDDNEPATEDTDSSGGTTSTGGETSATGGAEDPESGGASSEGGAAPTGSGGTTSECTDDLGPDNRADYTPLCALNVTVAGEEPKKNIACTADDVQTCYRTCGPMSVGLKTETCEGGVYVEGDCEFPTGVDYSCFSIPDTIDAATCPTEAPQATEPCDVPICTLCNLAGSYLTSTGDVKTGYCVCREPNDDGDRTWTCASATAWPCPMAACCG